MSWFLCTVGRSEPQNWDLCKKAGLWGVPKGLVKAEKYVNPGDHLLFWIGGKGYVAYGVVAGPPRQPQSREEAPWPGGKYRFETVIPFVLQVEVRRPLKLAFVANRQVETGFATVMFQRSLARISEADAARVTEALLTQALEEEEASEKG